MSDGPAERSVDELEQELQSADALIDELREAEGRGAYEHEIAVYLRLYHELYDAELNAYYENHRLGSNFDFFHGFNPPQFDQAKLDAWVAAVRKPPPGAEAKRRLDEALAESVKSPKTDAGGRPLEAVMPLEKAVRLQTVIDRELANGHKPNISQLAEFFGVTRDRIRQAIELRKAGEPLSETREGFSTVFDGEPMAYWPRPKKPS